MSKIIAGTFEQADQAEAVVLRLNAAGVARDQVSTVFVNPPGQHDRFPIGGDEDKSAGSTGAHRGAAGGAAIGTAVGIGVGLAAMPFVGPAGIAAGMAAGAYAGSLAGGVEKMGEQHDENQHADIADVAVERKGGMLVAATSPDPAVQAAIARILREAGARDIEEAEGRWEGGSWADFDPTRPPRVRRPA